MPSVVSIFTSTGTWPKPSGGLITRGILIGQGGGAGSGRSATQGGGGGGGAGGCLTTFDIVTSVLGATETVTVNGGGQGAVGALNGNGNAGTDGVSTVFGSGTPSWARAGGGVHGSSGTTTGGTGGTAGTGLEVGGVGGIGGNGTVNPATSGAAPAALTNRAAAGGG